MDRILQILKHHYSLQPKNWDNNIKGLRKELKDLGFYRMDLSKRNDILLKAKNQP